MVHDPASTGDQSFATIISLVFCGGLQLYSRTTKPNSGLGRFINTILQPSFLPSNQPLMPTSSLPLQRRVCATLLVNMSDISLIIASPLRSSFTLENYYSSDDDSEKPAPSATDNPEGLPIFLNLSFNFDGSSNEPSGSSSPAESRRITIKIPSSTFQDDHDSDASISPNGVPLSHHISPSQCDISRAIGESLARPNINPLLHTQTPRITNDIYPPSTPHVSKSDTRVPLVDSSDGVIDIAGSKDVSISTPRLGIPSAAKSPSVDQESLNAALSLGPSPDNSIYIWRGFFSLDNTSSESVSSEVSTPSTPDSTTDSSDATSSPLFPDLGGNSISLSEPYSPPSLSSRLMLLKNISLSNLHDERQYDYQRPYNLWPDLREEHIHNDDEDRDISPNDIPVASGSSHGGYNLTDDGRDILAERRTIDLERICPPPLFRMHSPLPCIGQLPEEDTDDDGDFEHEHDITDSFEIPRAKHAEDRDTDSSSKAFSLASSLLLTHVDNGYFDDLPVIPDDDSDLETLDDLLEDEDEDDPPNWAWVWLERYNNGRDGRNFKYEVNRKHLNWNI